MVPVGDGTWGAFIAGLNVGAPYRFWVAGSGSTGLKRDPRARELSVDTGLSRMRLPGARPGILSLA